jgi:soluble lytic murein transglycosylase-like protein
VIPGARLWLLYVTLLGLLIARATPADEGISRRLATLNFLAGRGAVESPHAVVPARQSATCERPNPVSSGLGRHATRNQVRTAVRDASLRFRVDRRLIDSVIRVESNYVVGAVSHKGAMGLMQLMPGTARELGVLCAFDPRSNVLGGTRYLRQLRDRLGSWPRALAGYHAGPNRVASGRIPAITHRYVNHVMRRWRPEADRSLAKF